MSLPRSPRSWTRQTNGQTFVISTDRALLSLPAINAAFASEYMYWASPFDEAVLRGILDNSFCFGLYRVTEPGTTPTLTGATPTENSTTDSDTPVNSNNDHLDQIGLARLITDSFTFAYLTDVYVLPEYQGLGLGAWMIECVDELMAPLPHLRWFMLRTGSETSRKAYERRLGMVVLENGDAEQGGVIMGRKGGAHPV